MTSRTFEYEDFDGNHRVETHYFNLTKAETIEWLSTNGDYTLDKIILQLIEENDAKKIMSIFRDLIWRSYGKKSLDGRKFIKTDEVKSEFMDTEAYSILFTELVTDGEKASAFINDILPKDFTAEIQKILDENPDGIPDAAKKYLQSPSLIQK